MKAYISRIATLFLIAVLFAPIADTALAQRTSRSESSPSSSIAMASGAYRIHIHQVLLDADPTTLGVEASPDASLTAAIVDVTNLGVTADFDPSILSIGGAVRSPLQMTDGVKGDTELSKTASNHLGLTTDGNLSISENNTVRISVVFALPTPNQDPLLVLRIGDQVADLNNAVVERLDLASITALVPVMDLRVADVKAVEGSGKLSVTFRNGTSESISLASVMTPEPGSEALPGCYFNESSAAISAMSNGTLWLEQDGDTGNYLAWINNPSTGTFDLLNARLVQEGFGGVPSNTQGSAYFNWLSTAEEYAKSEGTGIWSQCKTASGEWINEPTPAPVPTKTPDEIRAEYQWIDARDLDIRPNNFKGEKIAVQGTVFTIQADGNFNFMQIWANGGDIPIVIVYIGDTTGVYEGTWVTAYGTGDGTFEGTNSFGGTIVQPLVRADILDW